MKACISLCPGDCLSVRITVEGQTLIYQLKAEDEGIVLDAVHNNNDPKTLESICWQLYSEHPDFEEV